VIKSFDSASDQRTEMKPPALVGNLSIDTSLQAMWILTVDQPDVSKNLAHILSTPTVRDLVVRDMGKCARLSRAF
jgi:hypothetical protein